MIYSSGFNFLGLVTSYHGLLACRFFLGLTEGGLLPGIMLYLSAFYPRHKLQVRVAVLFCATSLAGAFSGLLAAAIVHMDGTHGRRGWAWIFILVRLLSLFLTIIESNIHIGRYIHSRVRPSGILCHSCLAPDD